MSDKQYYYYHTNHYLKTDLAKIPSFAWIKKALQVKSADIILDAGCGTGYLLNFVTPKKAKGVGVDISEFAVKTAQRKFPHLQFQVADLTKVPFPKNYFDKILCFNVIEHIKDQEKVMKELSRVLKKNGVLVIGTNIKNSLSWKLFKLFFGGDPTHIHEFTQEGFLEFVDRYFTITDWTRSSCIARFSPTINSLLHKFLKGDIIIEAKKHPKQGRKLTVV